MVPQRYLKRVLEVRTLMSRSQKVDWRETLREALRSSMLEEQVTPEAWIDVLAEAEEHTLRVTGIKLEMKNDIPF